MAATASEKAEYLVRKPPAHRNPAPSIGMAPGTRTRDKRGTVTHETRSRRARFLVRETQLGKTAAPCGAHPIVTRANRRRSAKVNSPSRGAPNSPAFGRHVGWIARYD